ncbi:hypothetical protein [Saccharothrix deserti]|uniref:hypothetical protein n=1 Tax=Saccharothrix deserti TaxID=2593674 RepID=UPI00131AE065|nr:hypothetical protein [Saccharothrix deserti]
MSALAELVELAARVLREHPDAPRVIDVSVSGYSPGEIRFQLPARSELGAVARWALALGTTVVITPHSTYYGITATALVSAPGMDAVRVEVWDHLDLAQLITLAQVLGLVVDARGGPVEISPQRLLDALDAVEPVERVA